MTANPVSMRVCLIASAIVMGSAVPAFCQSSNPTPQGCTPGKSDSPNQNLSGKRSQSMACSARRTSIPA
jgi:hypothetical protein